MQVGYFTVKGNNCFDELISFVRREFKYGYQSEFNGGVLFYIEDYSMANVSDVLVVIRIQKVKSSDSACEVEIVAGGGADGYLAMTFGNEGRKIDRSYKKLSNFCSDMLFEHSELVSTN